MGIFLTVLLSGFGAIAGSSSVEHKAPQITGGEYWPWGKEVNFPWKNIQGVWVASDRFGHKSYFSFKVLNNSSEKILKVQEFDNDSCQVLGRGIGFEQNRVVKARFTGFNGDYDLRIHVFRECDLIKEGGYRPKADRDLSALRTVPVMALSPAGSPGLSTVVPIYRVNANPEIVCE